MGWHGVLPNAAGWATLDESGGPVRLAMSRVLSVVCLMKYCMLGDSGRIDVFSQGQIQYLTVQGVGGCLFNCQDIV